MSGASAAELEATVALLARTPAALDALLRGLPERWTQRGEGEGSWSAQDVVAHLAYAERVNWLPRVRFLLEAGEARPFAPFDQQGHRLERPEATLDELLDTFARRRAESLEALRALALRPEDLARRGRHPTLGTVTLAQLLATWAAHDLTHLHQLSRVMAHQHREAVGPWAGYLGVLRCGRTPRAPIR